MKKPPPKKTIAPEKLTGLYHARMMRGMTTEQLAKATKSDKSTIGKLENGVITLTRAWTDRLAPHLGFTSEEILFWDKHHPSVDFHLESSDVLAEKQDDPSAAEQENRVRELDTRGGMGGGGVPSRDVRREGNYADPMKPEGWVFPPSYLREIGISASRLVVLDSIGDSMHPTISSGERVLVDTWHKRPSPDGIYALRDNFGTVVIKRLQPTRTQPPQLRIISDNPNHPPELVGLDEVDIVGKVVIALRRL